jgi:hypothetical protein
MKINKGRVIHLIGNRDGSDQAAPLNHHGAPSRRSHIRVRGKARLTLVAGGHIHEFDCQCRAR